MSLVLDHALWLANHGWRILPVHSVHDDLTCTCGKGAHGKDTGKHPRIIGWKTEATTDPNTLRSWFTRWPNSNVGIATGSASNLLVLDIDGELGAATLNVLETEHGQLPITLTVRTGSGGLQMYFRWSPSCAGLTVQAGVRPGIDYRGEGGQAVAPPSRHWTGNYYRWEVGPDAPVAEPPEWLTQILRSDQPKTIMIPSAKAIGEVTVESDCCDLFEEGVGEGGRNRELCRRVGKHLARGDSRATVEALAVAWAEKCDPPLDENETRNTVANLWAKESVKQGIHGGNDECEESEESHPTPSFASFASFPQVNATPLPAEQWTSFASFATEWPVLPSHAYHGLAGEIVRVVDPQTEADPAGILISLLTSFGSTVGRGPHFRVGSGRHHANLFTLLVGDTASGKGMAWDIAHDLLRRADPAWERECLAYGLSSGEGLIDRLRDEAEANSNGVSPIEFRVESEKSLLCLETEFAKLIVSMRREGNVLSALLRSAWDSKPLECLTRAKQKLRANAAHVSVIGHITPDEYAKVLERGTEVANGFSNRFLHCLVRSQKCLPHGGDGAVLDPFVEPLSNAILRAREIGQVLRSAQADRVWEEAYPRLKQSKAGAYGRAIERARPQAMRLALVYALLDGSNRIETDHMNAGLAVWDYCDRSARIVFEREQRVQPAAQPPIEPLPQKLLRIILASPGVSRTQLHDSLGRHVRADDLDSALAVLTANGQVEARQVRGSGRPAECWFVREERVEPSVLVVGPTACREESERSEETVQILTKELSSSCEESERSAGEASDLPSLPSRTMKPKVAEVTFSEELVKGTSLLGLGDLLAWVAANARQLVVLERGMVGCTPAPLPEAVHEALTLFQPELRGFVPTVNQERTQPSDLALNSSEDDYSFLDDLRT